MMIRIIMIFFLTTVSADDGAADDGAAMSAVRKGFQPHPPGWSSFAYCKWKGVECNPVNRRVVSFNVSGLSLRGVISPDITFLPELVEINLQNNQLSGDIPKLPKHINFIYRPGNPLLIHNSGDEKLSTGVLIAIIIGGAVVLICILVLGYYMVLGYYLRKSTPEIDENGGTGDVHRALIGSGMALGVDSGHEDYPIEYLRQATNYFSEENVLGRGGSSVVYRGVQSDGTIIAVKRISVELVDERTMREFNNEISLLTTLRHKNMVSLLGFCHDGNEKLLVYEYMPGGTLAHRLFECSTREYTPLTWSERVSIALDVARGIEYLHGLARRSYIHRDLKPSNILLGDEMRAKISDFGSIKLLPEGTDRVQAETVVGTYDYIDPDYFDTNWVSKKADVYAFGVILLEMIIGKTASDDRFSNEKRILLTSLSLEDTTFMNLIDGSIATDEETVESVKKVAKLAESCTSVDPRRRPNMTQTVYTLVPLVEQWEPPCTVEYADSEKDTTSLLYAEPSSQPSTSGSKGKEIEMIVTNHGDSK